MNADPGKTRCNSCGIDVPGYNGVHLTHKGATRFLCSKCYNESVSEMTGLDFDHLSFHPITLKDGGNEDHMFHFQTHLFGDHVSIRALEIRHGEPRGYEFTIRGDPEGDLFGLFSKLVERMRRELRRRHIEPGELTPYSITDEDIVRGHIAWDEDTDGQLPCLIIDGKEITWHEFGRMLMTYEGFHFKLEIFEGDEER